MNCDYVQEKLSAFLDREESLSDVDGVLSHLYACESCQGFFSSAIKFRSLANEDRTPVPFELDESIMKASMRREKSRLLDRRLSLPVYAVSLLTVVLLVVSFVFGFMMQEDVHRREINSLLKATPSQVLYGMPTQVVYPVSMRETKGGVR